MSLPQLTLLRRVLPKKRSGLQLVRKLPAFYGARRFITVFTNARHLSPSSAYYVSLFSCLRRTKWSAQVRSPVKRFYLQAAGTPLVGYPRLLIQYNLVTLHIWRPFLHPQPEDAPCCGYKDPSSIKCGEFNELKNKQLLHRDSSACR